MYQREWYSKVLLMGNKPTTEEVDDKDFFSPDDIRTSIKNQLSFASCAPKAYHEFRLIEIESDTYVNEIASFIYPFWKGQKQCLYFSKNGEFMFEILTYSRFHIYRKIPLKDPSRPSRCKWEMVRRISNIPSQFIENTQHPFYMAPDFMQYLDIDQRENIFIIRDTIT